MKQSRGIDFGSGESKTVITMLKVTDEGLSLLDQSYRAIYEHQIVIVFGIPADVLTGREDARSQTETDSQKET